MNCKLVTLLALIAIIFGSAICQATSTSDIELRVFDSSNAWWIAVDPINDGDQTQTVELQEAASSVWTQMAPNDAWGYWQLASTSGNGFALPLSFRLTSASGAQVVVSDAMDAITPGAVVDAKSTYGSGHNTPAPTQRATQAPTQHATQAPTQHATQAPTQHATQAPTQHATQAPTQHATQAPTQHATQAPTQHATQAPTQHATQAPTQHATQAPTSKPTTAPTQHATQAPTSKPTTKPSTTTGSSSSSGSSTNLCTVTSTSEEPLIVLVPLYVDPGSDWDTVLAAAATGVPIMAIINPDDGPISTGPDSSYTTYMQKFADAGITMVGYVHSGYGTRSVTTVMSEIDTYAAKYPGLTGIFVDEASADSSEIAYYTQLYNHILSIDGYVHDIINPGTQPDEGYMAAATNIVIFEDVGSNLKNNYASWVGCAPSAAEKAGYKYKFSGIAYGAASTSVSSLLSTMNTIGMGMVYVTESDDVCCVYNELAPYFATEASYVNALN